MSDKKQNKNKQTKQNKQTKTTNQLRQSVTIPLRLFVVISSEDVNQLSLRLQTIIMIIIIIIDAIIIIISLALRQSPSLAVVVDAVVGCVVTVLCFHLFSIQITTRAGTVSAYTITRDLLPLIPVSATRNLLLTLLSETYYYHYSVTATTIDTTNTTRDLLQLSLLRQ